MSFALKGLREFNRAIALQRAHFSGNIQKALDREIEYLGAKIKMRLGRLGQYVQIDLQKDTISLKYLIGTTPKGKPITTAKDYHNPASKRFNIAGQRQPFQDVLAEEGYIDISPAPGQPIPISSREAPGVRITAKVGPGAKKRIIGFMR